MSDTKLRLLERDGGLNARHLSRVGLVAVTTWAGSNSRNWGALKDGCGFGFGNSFGSGNPSSSDRDKGLGFGHACGAYHSGIGICYGYDHCVGFGQGLGWARGAVSG